MTYPYFHDGEVQTLAEAEPLDTKLRIINENNV